MNQVLRLSRSYSAAQETTQAILLASDLHVDASSFNSSHCRADLDWALANDADIFLNGDIFEDILNGDPRHTPSVPDAKVQSNDAQIDYIVDMVSDFLLPYAKNIRMVAVGNHEETALKHYKTDLIARLIDKIGPESIHHGGYDGAIVYSFRQDTGKGCSFNIFYTHGFGGASTKNKGTIDFNHLASYVQNADALWMGHKHWRYVVEEQCIKIPQYASGLERRSLWYLMSGPYTKPKDRFKDGKYQYDWAKKKGFRPQGQGAIKLVLKPTAKRKDKAVVKVRAIVDQDGF